MIPCEFNMTTNSNLPYAKRLTMIEQGYCDFSRRNCGSSYMYFFEGDAWFGWQYSENQEANLEKAIVNQKRLNCSQMKDTPRRILYLKLKKNVEDENIHENENGEDYIVLKSPELSKKLKSEDLHFFINRGSVLRMSTSQKTLIWIEQKSGIFCLFKDLIRENPTVFEKKWEDSIFKIDTEIHDDEDVYFWTNILKCCYDC